jgi:hypothetical protein
MVWSILTLFMSASSCGSKKSDEEPRKKPTPTKVNEEAQPTQPTLPENEPLVPKNDPLLGSWRVVEATGKNAEVNKGTEYVFGADGKVHVRSHRSNPEVRARDPKTHLGPPETRKLVVNEWSWKRTSPTQIEMNHEASPLTAIITITIKKETMKFVWNTNGSAFTMQKIDTSAPPTVKDPTI